MYARGYAIDSTSASFSRPGLAEHTVLFRPRCNLGPAVAIVAVYGETNENEEALAGFF
jgi:hypothetical protein